MFIQQINLFENIKKFLKFTLFNIMSIQFT
jgi:hypothetical protein